MTFNPARLSLARRRRGFTKIRLAQEAELTARSVTAYESGRTEPLPDTVVKLATALAFPVEFFAADDLEEINPNGVTFRSLSRLTAAKRDQALAAASLALELHGWIDARFRLPELDLPDHLAGFDPERAAEVVRAEWGRGEKPISNMVHLLEAHGIRVFSVAEDFADVDAFSCWHPSGVPFIFLNTMKTSERSRMDAAHELAHLVLHREEAGTRSRRIEEEAKRFASAFLMPRADLLARSLHFATIEQLIAAKRRWKVALSALALRLHSLGVLSEWHYRSLCIDISRRGFRKSEPDGIKRETSQILTKVLSTLREDRVTRAAIARDLHLTVKDLNALMFGMAITSVEGSGADTGVGERPAGFEVIHGGAA